MNDPFQATSEFLLLNMEQDLLQKQSVLFHLIPCARKEQSCQSLFNHAAASKMPR
jgi:hypothetical protein